MRLLLDTHLILWAAWFDSDGKTKLPEEARILLSDTANALVFSAASLWEIVIKSRLGRADFNVDPRLLRRGLIDNGYGELPVTGAHALAVRALPDLHKDPFDRILVAQATVEGITLLTSDAVVAAYPGPVHKV